MLDKLIIITLVLGTLAAPPSNEEVALAQIMQGEAHHQYMASNYDGAYCVGWVARNRLLSQRYGSSYAEIQAGFNGTISSVPQREYLVLARLAINGEEDPTRGAVYVFSQQDVDHLGFNESEALLVIRASKNRALIFFAKWPQSRKKGVGKRGL